MTKQEAIETIKLALSQVEWDYPMDYAVAFDMAISALEKQDVPDTNVGNMISRQDAIDSPVKMVSEGLEWIPVYHIKELPSAEPEVRTQMSSADCISRQAAIRFVKTECNPYGKPTLDFESGKKVIEHLEQMPSAQPVLTCKGCKYDYYEYAGCRNCLRRERDLYEPE